MKYLNAFLKSFALSVILFIISSLAIKWAQIRVFSTFGFLVDQLERGVHVSLGSVNARILGSILILVLLVPLVKWVSDRFYVKSIFSYLISNYTKLLNQPMYRIDKFDEGELIDRFNEDIGQLQQLFYKILGDGILNLVLLIASLWYVTVLDYRLLGLLLILLTVQFLLVVIQKKTYQNSLVKHQEGKTNRYSSEDRMIEAFEYIKARNITNTVLDNEVKQSESDFHEIFKHVDLESKYEWQKQSFDVLSQLLFTLALVYTYSLKSLEAESLITAFMLLSYAKQSISELTRAFESFNLIFPIVERVDDLIGHSHVDEGTLSLKEIESVAFKNVTFSYDGSSNVLENFNLNVEKGLNYLKGSNGFGKSTAIKLLAGLYKPDKGEIIINGKLISTYKRSNLAKQVSVATQDPFLLNDTVSENIKLFTKCSSDRFLSCTDLLDLSDLLDKKVENNGGNLSGGERQKISLARCLLKEASLYVFDEPFNSLDVATRKRVKDYIESMEKTTLIISHN